MIKTVILEDTVNYTVQYIEEALGVQIQIAPIEAVDQKRLPLYLRESYKLYRTTLFQTQLILAEETDAEGYTVARAEKNLHQLRNEFNQPVVLLLENVPAFTRKRLIEKQINFIVPKKQLYLPGLLVDLRERFDRPKPKLYKEKLLPSAQLLLLFHLLNRNEHVNIELQSFKELARYLSYTPMAISNAVENLRINGLIDILGEKEKSIRFRYNRAALWANGIKNQFFTSPVLKTIYVDKLPESAVLLYSNMSALSEYTDLNPSRQIYYAIDKSNYYDWQKKKLLVNPNDVEGNFALEIWKYKPETLANLMGNSPVAVDPLSLLLSQQNSIDERLQMALNKIEELYIW